MLEGVFRLAWTPCGLCTQSLLSNCWQFSNSLTCLWSFILVVHMICLPFYKDDVNIILLYPWFSWSPDDMLNLPKSSNLKVLSSYFWQRLLQNPSSSSSIGAHSVQQCQSHSPSSVSQCPPASYAAQLPAAPLTVTQFIIVAITSWC